LAIILIRRCVRVDKESEFLASYNRNKPAHADFIDECLTKVNDSSDLPTAMRSLPIGGENCVEPVRKSVCGA